MVKSVSVESWDYVIAQDWITAMALSGFEKQPIGVITSTSDLLNLSWQAEGKAG